MEIGIFILIASLANVPGNALREHSLDRKPIEISMTNEQCMKQMDIVVKNMPDNKDWTLQCVISYPISEQLWQKWNFSYKF